MDFLFKRSLLTALKFVVMAVPLKLIFALFVSMMRNKAVRGLPVSDEVYEAIEPNLTEGERLGMEMYQAINNDVVTARPTGPTRLRRTRAGFPSSTPRVKRSSWAKCPWRKAAPTS